MIPARFIDVGLLDPAVFHATYAGIAGAAARESEPAVMWGRARAHMALGQSQDPGAELAPDIGVPVVTRPLGGGAVWVDEAQYCFVLVAPRAAAPARPGEWFGWGLAPAIATYRRFGLAAERRDQDLWLDGRKIGGSGAATIGRCAVLAGSFLLSFPAERFARCIASPLRPGRPASSTFRRWLLDGLEQTMTDWGRHQRPPAGDELRRAFREAVESTLNWRLVDGELSAKEAAAREEALAELAQPQCGGRRLVAGGVRLNAAAFLTEKRSGKRIVRELIVNGVVVRRAPAVA
jgi:lipoate---protein ligase